MSKPDGKQMIEEAKNKAKKQKGNNEMKSNKKTVIVTVLLTVLTIATIIGLLYAGFVFGTEYQKGIEHQVTSQVKEMATIVSKDVKQ